MSEDKTKILEKIKKCLALSKSSNEHEAAAALRQAQKLMAMHSLSEEDVDGVDYVCAEVLTDYEFGKKKPLVIVTVAALMQHALGVEVVMGARRSGRGLIHCVTYCGSRARVVTATYAHAVVYRAVGNAWKRFKEENPGASGVQGARAGFYLGWCDAVTKKVEKLVVDPIEKKYVEKAMNRHFGGQTGQAEVSGTKVHGATVAAGAEAAKDFELNKPIGQNRMQIGVDK